MSKSSFTIKCACMSLHVYIVFDQNIIPVIVLGREVVFIFCGICVTGAAVRTVCVDVDAI